MKSLNEDLKTGQFKQIYLLYGEEAYLKKLYKNRFVKAMIPEGDTMNYRYFEGKNTNPKEIIDLAETLPFFAERRLIVLENTGFLKNATPELAEYLNKEGYNVTQATVSRDIRELKLSKIQTENGGQKYAVFHPQTAFNDKYTRILHDSFVSMDMAQNILVIKTVSGMAMAVAAALDAIHFSEIVGCIAGDDTVMCAVRTVDDTIVLMDKIRKLIAG